MARKTLETNISFADIYSRILFTAVAVELAAEDEAKELKELVTALNQLLGRWEELNGDRQSQQRATIRSNAQCKRRNLQLDAALTAVHHATLAEVMQYRQSPLFLHLFPSPLSILIKPALEGQLKVTVAFLERLKSSDASPSLRKTHEKALARGIELGEAAQQQRTVAQAAAAALTGRVEALWQDANVALLLVEGTLKQLAAKKRLSKEWIDSFFPEAASKTKKKYPPVGDSFAAHAASGG